MSFVDWPLGSGSESAARPTSSTLSISTIEALSGFERDIAQAKITGRRSWKGVKGEAIWPPNLSATNHSILSWFIDRILYREVILLEGSPQLRPHDFHPTHLLLALQRYHERSWRPAIGRFPMRNRFISDYIYEETGKRRTAKQVGSRLQQLRETCKQENSRSQSFPFNEIY